MCHYSSLWVQQGLIFKITQVWNIIRFTSRLFDDLAKYRGDLFLTLSIWSVWGRMSLQHSMCLCLRVFIPQASPHCPVYRNNSVMFLVTEHTPNSQRQPTLPASKPSQQLTSWKTALSTQKYWKDALQNQEWQRIWNNISTILNL